MAARETRPQGDPHVRSLVSDAEGWYAFALVPGRYHLNAVSNRHLPTPREVPRLVLEILPGDKVAFAGAIEVSCRDQLPPDKPGSSLYDCDPPTIRTDEAGTAARLSGDATVDPAVRAARPLSELASEPGVLVPGTVLRVAVLRIR